MVIRPTTVVSAANLMIKGEVCMATQSWVKREYRRGLSTHPCGEPVLRISEGVVFYLHHLGATRQEVQGPVAQGGARPRVLSLMMSLEGTMVLTAKL